MAGAVRPRTECRPAVSRKRMSRVGIALRRDKYLLILMVPVLAYYLIFHYVPMYGALIAFQDFSPGKGVAESSWVGVKWFIEFFRSPFFGKLLKNTVVLSLYTVLWGFPIPIVFALMLNEIENGYFKKIIQSVSYFPYFISVVVMVGILNNIFSSTDGLANTLLAAAGLPQQQFLSDPSWFRTLYVGSNVWQNFGFTSIIYLAALSAIDPQLYESSRIDGATRWQNIWYITLPCLMPTIIMMFILRMGQVMNVGFEKAFLLYRPSNASVSDILSLYIYRKGINNMEFSLATAVGLFNSAVNCLLLLVTNGISRRRSGQGIW